MNELCGGSMDFGLWAFVIGLIFSFAISLFVFAWICVSLTMEMIR